MVINLPANTGDIRNGVQSLGWEDSPGGRNDNPLQYSCLENPMDRGAWWAAVHGVAQSWTGLKRLSSSSEWLHFHFLLSCIGEGNGNPLQCSCLEDPRDGGAWWATIYGVAQNWTATELLNWTKLNWKWLSSSSRLQEGCYPAGGAAVTGSELSEGWGLWIELRSPGNTGGLGGGLWSH